MPLLKKKIKKKKLCPSVVIMFRMRGEKTKQNKTREKKNEQNKSAA